MTESAASHSCDLVVTFPREVYAIEAVKRAAYRLSDCLAVDIEVRANEIACRLAPFSRDKTIDIIELSSRFKNEVLDQDLRARIAKETESYRNLILSLAFSKTGAVE